MIVRMRAVSFFLSVQHSTLLLFRIYNSSLDYVLDTLIQSMCTANAQNGLRKRNFIQHTTNNNIVDAACFECQ